MKFAVHNASFAYRDKPVFEDVSFEVNSGEILAILGPNGSGKTTLLRTICGMLRLGGGTSMIDGENVSAISERQLWSLMSYVPQIRNAATSYTVLESVLLGLCSRIGVFSTPSNDEIKKAEEVLRLLGISYLRDKRCHEISGGELQMVLIARALVSDPKLLILDEPESGLDFRNQLIVLDTLSRLSRDGIACIFNTHYPEHALRYADKSLLLSGTHAVFGETKAILTPENIEKAFGVSVTIHEFEADGEILRGVIPLCIKDKRI